MLLDRGPDRLAGAEGLAGSSPFSQAGTGLAPDRLKSSRVSFSSWGSGRRMAACDGVVWEIQARGVSLLQRRASGRTVFRTMPWMAVLFLAVPLGVIAGSVTIMVKASGADQPAVVALFAV